MTKSNQKLSAKTRITNALRYIDLETGAIIPPIQSSATFMARIGAKTVHKMDKNKISKYLGFFLLIISAKFLYEYLKL